MTYHTRLYIVLAITLIACASTLLINPVAQDPAYHLFADRRGCLGIPNFANVASNIGFPIVGIAGLWVLLRNGITARHGKPADMLPYGVFLIGIALIGVGSAYYHWQPDNQTLFWDRLPIAVAFMAFTAAVVADRIDRSVGLKIILPILLILGPASLVYWSATEAQGRGDLRFYALVQFLPIILIPVMCWLFPEPRRTKGRYIAGMLVAYGFAKLFEIFDFQIYDLAGGWVSGHTLKHLAAAVAAAFIIPMLRADPMPDE